MRDRPTTRQPWVILAASLLLTGGAAAFVWRSNAAVVELRFDNAVQAATDRITGRLEIYSTILRGGAAFFGASDTVTADEFHRFVNRLGVQTRFPGIQGVGWTERLARMPGETPDERHAIRYLEPLDDRNQAAIGFDMYSEPTRRVAMARARDAGTRAMSGRVILVQEIRGPQQPGFLLYVPVYAAGAIPSTVEDRRRLLRGFVYAPFRAEDLFAGIFGTERRPRVSFTVYDGTEPDEQALLYRSPATTARHTISRTVPVELAGRPWTVVFRPEPGIGFGLPLFWLVLGGGLLVSMVIGWLAFAQARARAAAEQASRAKSEFLAVMSHELRTPLNAIGGYVELLELGIHGPVSDEQAHALGRVRRAKDHLLGLINNVLNYARIEAGRVEFRQETIAVEDLLDGVSDMIAPQAESKELTFTRTRRQRDVSVWTDREKAQQVLLNLLSNAVKFTPPDGRVSLSWQQDGDAVVISVEDSGVGISPDKLETIFDPFVQVDLQLTRDRAGSGLGLAIARDLSRAMGGDVTVRSEPGVGSTFSLRLPARRSSADRMPAETAAAH